MSQFMQLIFDLSDIVEFWILIPINFTHIVQVCFTAILEQSYGTDDVILKYVMNPVRSVDIPQTK